MESSDTSENGLSHESAGTGTQDLGGRQDSYARVPQEQQDTKVCSDDLHCQPQAATKIVVVDGHADDELKWKQNLASAMKDRTVTHLSIAHVDLSAID